MYSYYSNVKDLKKSFPFPKSKAIRLALEFKGVGGSSITWGMYICRQKDNFAQNNKSRIKDRGAHLK